MKIKFEEIEDQFRLEWGKVTTHLEPRSKESKEAYSDRLLRSYLNDAVKLSNLAFGEKEYESAVSLLSESNQIAEINNFFDYTFIYLNELKY